MDYGELLDATNYALTLPPGDELFHVMRRIKQLAKAAWVEGCLPTVDCDADLTAWRRGMTAFRNAVASLTTDASPQSRDWREFAATCREIVERLESSAGKPLDNLTLGELPRILAAKARQLRLSLCPLGFGFGWDSNRSPFGTIAYRWPHGAVKELPIRSGAGESLRPCFDHAAIRTELVSVMNRWAEFADRKADEPPLQAEQGEGKAAAGSDETTTTIDDDRDYETATKIRTKYAPAGVVLEQRHLVKFLDSHKEIRWKRPRQRDGLPRENRLLVHLADWMKHETALREWYKANVTGFDDVSEVSEEEAAERQAAIRTQKQRRK